MVTANNSFPYKWRLKREPLLLGPAKYFAQLINARREPQTYSIPVYYRHIGGLAQSISLREITESVLVLVEPGLAGPGFLARPCSVASYANVTERDRDSSLLPSSYKLDWPSKALVCSIGKPVDNKYS